MIPESQLSTWANAGASQSATTTYTSIKAALDAGTTLKGRQYNVYLQGSYRNSMNVYGDMDVDIVVELTSVFGYDISNLTDVQKGEFQRRFPGSAEYTPTQFRNDVEAALVAYYGRDLVVSRNKCLQVTAKSGRLDADVLPCRSFKRYDANPPVALPVPHEGIQFFTRDENRSVVNFPSQHYENGVKKNGATSDRFKPTVRIFKNLRNYLLAENLISAEAAPSYFVTCLIYNAPNSAFQAKHAGTVLAILKWLHDLDDEAINKLVCENELVWLCRDAPDRWKPLDAKKFRNAAISAWNDWGK